MRKKEILHILSESDLPQNSYWVIMGAAMVLHGLREETSDVDLGCTKRLADALEKDGYAIHMMEDGKRHIVYSPDIELFEDWYEDCIETINGLSIVSVKGLVQMKRKLGRWKDLNDIERIQKIFPDCK